MNTPICDFIKGYTERGALRLHMPGHKGVPTLGFEPADITEIDGADVLYRSSGIIRRSEENAAELFGAARTLYSCEGSSLSIRAMLYLCLLWAKSRGQRPVIAAARNAHKVFMTAVALLDIRVDWLGQGMGGGVMSCRITPDSLDSYLRKAKEKPVAVYITSPDYLGEMADISGLAAVCRCHGVLLLVDNAHGAYLRFLPESKHPIQLGAHMCVDSAHKSLPVLTGGGYLHISVHAPDMMTCEAERAMAMFASTSPSYLILQSLDAVNPYLADEYRGELSGVTAVINELKERLRRQGYALVGEEPLKVTVSPKSYGYTGEELAKVLRCDGVECEFADSDYLVMMITPCIIARELCRVGDILCALPRRAPITSLPPEPPVAESVLTPRQALLGHAIELPLRECEGRVLADTALCCPPAVPIVVSGERITREAVACLEYYGITSCLVVEN